MRAQREDAHAQLGLVRSTSATSAAEAWRPRRVAVDLVALAMYCAVWALGVGAVTALLYAMAGRAR